jgi:hypothetical protein
VAVLVGKSTTRLLTALLIAAGIFPFVLLALALGGVTVHQIVSGSLALCAYLVLVANLGLLASVVSRTTGRASVLAGAALFFLIVMPFAGPKISTALISARWATPGSPLIRGIDTVSTQLELISPLERLSKIMETGFAETVWSRQVVVHLSASLLMFVLSWGLFRWSCEYLPEARPSRGGILRRRAGKSRSTFRRWLTPRAWRHALAWKDYQFIAGGTPGLILRMMCIPLAACVLYFADDLSWAASGLSFGEAIQGSLLSIAAIDLLYFSSRIFQAEYRWGTLCTLALLPRSTLYLCYTKACGCALGFLPVVLWFLASIVILPPNAGIWPEKQFLDRLVVLICLAAVLGHLTALFSLSVKWGALPLAIMVMMVLVSCGSPFVAVATQVSRVVSNGQNSVMVPVIYLTFLTCAALQIAIGLRFRRAAAE